MNIGKWNSITLEHIRNGCLRAITRRFDQGTSKWVILFRENPMIQQQIQKGKFEPNWLGLYVVTTLFGSSANKLSTTKGEKLKDPINALHLK